MNAGAAGGPRNAATAASERKAHTATGGRQLRARTCSHGFGCSSVRRNCSLVQRRVADRPRRHTRVIVRAAVGELFVLRFEYSHQGSSAAAYSGLATAAETGGAAARGGSGPCSSSGLASLSVTLSCASAMMRSALRLEDSSTTNKAEKKPASWASTGKPKTVVVRRASIGPSSSTTGRQAQSCLLELESDQRQGPNK